MDLFDLAVTMRANGEAQAMATMKRVETAGKQSAAVLNKTMAVTSEQARVAWQKSGGDFERFKAHLASVAGASTQTAKAQVQAQQQVQVATQATTRTMEQQRMATDALRMRVGMGAIAMAGALEMMARQGKVTGESLRQLVVQGSLMATMYGPQGAIIGAVGVAGVALFSFFTRAQKEAEELRKKSAEAAAEIRKMGFEQAAALSGDLFARLGAEQATLARLRAENRQVTRVGGGQNTAATTVGSNDAEIRATEARIKQLRDQHTAAQAQFTATVQKHTEVMANAARITRELAGEEEKRRRAMTAAERAAAERTARAETPIGPMGLANIYSGTFKRVDSPLVAADADLAIGAREQADEALRAIEEAQKAIYASLDEQIRVGVGNALYNAFSAAFNGDGIAGVIRSFASSILAAFGQMIVQIGLNLIKFGALAETFTKAFKLLGVFGGPVAIAVGAGLIALGGSMGAGGRGGGGGSGGGGGYGNRTTTYALSPAAQNAGRGITPRESTPVYITSIGKPRPADVRTMTDAVAKGVSQRGMQRKAFGVARRG